MSVTLPAMVEDWPLWITIVSALFTWTSTLWLKSMYTMWVPAVEFSPLVIVELKPENDSKPAHVIAPPTPPLLGLCCKLT